VRALVVAPEYPGDCNFAFRYEQQASGFATARSTDMPKIDTPDAARMKQLLSGLVGYASENPPGREAEVALYLTAIMKELGFNT
jgi:hypothetical protein